MNQHLLRLRLPTDHLMSPSDLRVLVAAENRPSPALFARNDDGLTVDYPGVRFIGAKTWVGVLADDEHADTLMKHTGDIIMAATKALKMPCPVEFEKHEFNLTPAHHLFHYRVSRMAIKRRHASARSSEINALVTRRVLAGIERSCLHYGIDCPTSSDLGLVGMNVSRSIGMRLDTDKGPTAEYVSLVDATFSLHAKLSGFWFVGNLTSRGHGRIIQQIDAGWNKEGA